MPYSDRHNRRAFDKRRRQSHPWRALYDTKEWKEGRLNHLNRHPLCEACLRKEPPRYEPATVVHHTEQHHGNAAIFFDRSKWESSCKPCHDADRQAAEASTRAEVDEDGWPKK